MTTTESSRADALDVALRINGVARRLALEPRVTLLDALREYLGLTGTKKGCDRGARPLRDSAFKVPMAERAVIRALSTVGGLA